MAMIFSGYRPRIALLMAESAKGPDLMPWLRKATYAKASTGHWLAWHDSELKTVAVLPPNHKEDGVELIWLESSEWSSIEQVIEYVESGEFDKEPIMELNLQILNEKTGLWE